MTILTKSRAIFLKAAERVKRLMEDQAWGKAD